MRIFLLLCFAITFTFATVFTLTNEEKKFIKNSPKKNFIITRFIRFQEFIKEARSYDTKKKLTRTNLHINKILPTHDNIKDGIGDVWSTPKEFLIEGRGDCEDYAIAKYFALLELGIKKEKLYLGIVKVKGNPAFHMVLLYLHTPASIPLVIDNLSWKVVPLTKRKDLIPQFAFNEIDSYNFKDFKFYQKVKIEWGDLDKWNELLKKVYIQKK